MLDTDKELDIHNSLENQYDVFVNMVKVMQDSSACFHLITFYNDRAAKHQFTRIPLYAQELSLELAALAIICSKSFTLYSANSGHSQNVNLMFSKCKNVK